MGARQRLMLFSAQAPDFKCLPEHVQFKVVIRLEIIKSLRGNIFFLRISSFQAEKDLSLYRA
jgi:hypothetical protein